MSHTALARRLEIDAVCATATVWEALRLLLLALLLLLVGSQRAHTQEPNTGILQGTVRADQGSVPLPYAVISIARLAIERFTDGQGRFTLTALAPGRYELLVRRIGFAPYRDTVNIDDGITTRVEALLVPIPLQLQSVTVQAVSHCAQPGAPDGRENPEVARLVSLLRENAERYRLLVLAHPFTHTQARALGTMDKASAPFRLQQVDTLLVQAVSSPGYRAGRVLRSERGRFGQTEYFISIPSIVDLADDAFARTHCFSYGGRESHDGETWLKLEARASDSLDTPDVNGTFFLDSASAQLRVMQLELSRPDLLPSILGDTERITVQTRFGEVAPGLSIIKDVCGATATVRRSRSTGRVSARLPLQGELQQLIAYRFTSAPEGVPATREFQSPRWERGGKLPKSAVWCAEQKS